MLTLRAMFLNCWKICVVCLALELIGSWVVVVFSVRLPHSKSSQQFCFLGLFCFVL